MTMKCIATTLMALVTSVATAFTQSSRIGREVAVPQHLQDGQEFELPTRALVEHGEKLFTAVWTNQEGGGRPLTKGTGNPLGDPKSPLVFPRDFNRVSAPDANSCLGCHNVPFGIAGGGADIVSNVFVLGQRFDFATFDPDDLMPTRGNVNEARQKVHPSTIGNTRNSLGMFGSGYIEMLARQITEDLQAIRNATLPGRSRALVSKGISFGVIARGADGNWITSGVTGIAAPSLTTTGPVNPPSLVIRPFHQAGHVISLRQFSNNAFNHHHGIQATERFGVGTDPDGDGFVNEMTRADVTAVTLFQATMAVPGRVIPNDPEIETAVWLGEQRFERIGCTVCHVPSLPLDRRGWIFTEPNPFNPEGNLFPGQPSGNYQYGGQREARLVSVDLSSDGLPSPRLKPSHGEVMVPAYTDLKLHDITSGPDDPNVEPLDMNQPPGSPGFFAGNRKFLTRKLWGAANEPPFFHHGQYTTLRQAVLAHAGEALASQQAFQALSEYEQGSVIEFLKTLQVLPPGTKHLIIDERGQKKLWPPFDLAQGRPRRHAH
jgi:hypothetical protein